MPASIKPGHKLWRPLLLSLALFALNDWICRELFSIEFIRNLDSNEGVFVSISRFYREYGFTQSWFPWFNAGMPIANAYQPPAHAGCPDRQTHRVVGRARLSFRSGDGVLLRTGGSFLVRLGLVRIGRAQPDGVSGVLVMVARRAVHSHPARSRRGPWGALRLYNLIHYAEDPHNVALSLLPLALLFLRRALAHRTALNLAGAIAASAAVVLHQRFRSRGLAIGGLCIVLALGAVPDAAPNRPRSLPLDLPLDFGLL